MLWYLRSTTLLPGEEGIFINIRAPWHSSKLLHRLHGKTHSYVTSNENQSLLRNIYPYVLQIWCFGSLAFHARPTKMIISASSCLHFEGFRGFRNDYYSLSPVYFSIHSTCRAVYKVFCENKKTRSYSESRFVSMVYSRQWNETRSCYLAVMRKSLVLAS